jgi:hypothetical protein
MTQATSGARPPVVEVVLPEARAWAVAWTKPRCEKVLHEYFVARRVPVFLPLVSKRRVYGHHIRYSLIPLFPGYVFFDQEVISRPQVFESRKVAQIITCADPAELRRDLANLAMALRADSSLRETRFGQTGRKVYVARGPMKGLFGELVKYEAQNRLIVRVNYISKAAELTIDEAFVEPIL